MERVTRAVKATLAAAVAASIIMALGGCSENGAKKNIEPDPSTYNVRIRALGADTIGGFQFTIDCVNPSYHNETYVALFDGTYNGHQFADLFAMLPAGAQCAVVAIAMENASTPAAYCEVPAPVPFAVLEGQTVEVGLTITCSVLDGGHGGIDTIVTINHKPSIVVAIPNKYPCVNEPIEIFVEGFDSDPQDTVTLSYLFGSVDPATGNCLVPFAPLAIQPPAGVALNTGANPWIFTSSVVGDYCIQATATDDHLPLPHGSNSQTFPIHVRPCVCCIDQNGMPHFPVESYAICKDEYNGNVFPIEECLCCQDRGGAAHMVSYPTDCNQPGQVLVPIDYCKVSRDVCCQVGYNDYEVMPSADCISGITIPMEKCDVCCKTDNGFQMTTVGYCDSMGFDTAPDSYCETCCKLDGGIFDTLPIVDCLNPAPASYCEMTCCWIQGQHISVSMEYGTCISLGLQPLPATDDRCGDRVCCKSELGVATEIRRNCQPPGETIVPLAECGMVCCYIEGYNVFATLIAGACDGQTGIPVPDGLCAF